MNPSKTEQIQVRDDQDLVTRGNDLVTVASSLKVVDDQSLYRATEHSRLLKDMIKLGEDHHAEAIDQAFKLHRTLTAMRNKIVEPLKLAYSTLQTRMAIYSDAQKRKREEEEEKARLEAEEKTKKEQEKLLAKGVKAEEKGDLEAAEHFVDQAEEVYVAPRPVAPIAKPAGFVLRYDYDVIIEKKEAVPEIYKTVDVMMIKRAYVNSKETLAVPGVKFIKRPAGSTRRI